MYKKDKKLCLNQSGFSIVETIVALTILVSAGLMMSYFSTHRFSQIVNKEFSDCTQHANVTLNKIRSLGVAKSVAILNPQTNRIVRPGGVENQVKFINANDEWLSPTETLWFTNGAGKTIYKSYKALIGSMSLLNSLYSSNPNFCTSPTGFVYTDATSFDLLESQGFAHLKNISSSIRIQPYELKTGAVRPCTFPLKVVPPQSNQMAFNGIATGVTAYEPSSDDDLGFLVSVFTQYEDNSGNNQSCSASAHYSYPNITVNPATLEDLSVNISRSSSSMVINNANSFSSCAARVNWVQVNMVTGVQDYATKRAMVMMCRDQSVYNPTPGATNCIGMANVVNDFTIDPEWKPCHLLTICGKDSDNPASAQNPQGYSLNYTNVNMGCQIRVEARLMDASKNVAAVASDDLMPPPTRSGCTPCSLAPGYIDRPGTSGWCPGGGRTVANSCDLAPPPPPPPSPDGGGADGSPDGGDSDGKGGDGGNK